MAANQPPIDDRKPQPNEPDRPTTAACPVCGGRLFEVRAKLQCSRCRTICETCCEGSRG